MKQLLVIRLSAMGDVAITVPVLLAFQEQYPDMKIILLTKPIFAPMFASLPNCEVFPIDLKGKHKGFLGLYRLFKELKAKKIDFVADLHNVLRSNVLKIFFKWNNIPFFQINKGRKEKKALTRAKNKEFRQLKTSYERYADVFEKLGFPISLEKKYFLMKKMPSKNVKKLLSEEKNIGIAPFASHLGKEYPFENLKKVIFQLSKVYPKAKIFIFGGGNHEKQIVEQISSLVNVENMVGKLPFYEELNLISHLDVMLAMDSGNAHLAAMYGVPTITLWGVTHPFAGFYPYEQPKENALLADREKFPLVPTSVYGNKYPYGYERAIMSISEENIFQKIVEILEK
ncbi:MAG: glycosyltransferase family 9 protein [Capnocytophaga sp.]|nr:glycosyltransferase family 9 protein [Capnocytophaga sp.]